MRDKETFYLHWESYHFTKQNSQLQTRAAKGNLYAYLSTAQSLSAHLILSGFKIMAIKQVHFQYPTIQEMY